MRYLRDPSFARRVQWLRTAAGFVTRKRAAIKIAAAHAETSKETANAWRERIRRWEATGGRPPLQQVERFVAGLIGTTDPEVVRWVSSGCGDLPQPLRSYARSVPLPEDPLTRIAPVERRKTWKAIMKEAQFAIASGPSAHEIARARVLELLKN